jgi:hypothetical protein
MFADPSFPPPHVSVYEERRHPWALAAGQLPLEHQFQPSCRNRFDVRRRRITERAVLQQIEDHHPG